MKSALIVVGKSLRYNLPFLNYIHTTITKHIDLPDQTVYIDKNDKAHKVVIDAQFIDYSKSFRGRKK